MVDRVVDSFSVVDAVAVMLDAVVVVVVVVAVVVDLCVDDRILILFMCGWSVVEMKNVDAFVVVVVVVGADVVPVVVVKIASVGGDSVDLGNPTPRSSSKSEIGKS